jgi:putative ABC transport system substrate-binding protein
LVFTTFLTAASRRASIAPQTLFLARRGQIVGLTLRHAVPAIFPWREAVEIGGLMSYASSLPELVINLQTAKTIGLDVPATMLTSADEVIE